MVSLIDTHSKLRCRTDYICQRRPEMKRNCCTKFNK